jgi:hypothetical protein
MSRADGASRKWPTPDRILRTPNATGPARAARAARAVGSNLIAAHVTRDGYRQLLR